MSNFNREAMIQAVLAEDVYLTKDGRHPHREWAVGVGQASACCRRLGRVII